MNNIESFYEFKIKCKSIDKKLRDFILRTSADGRKLLPSTIHQNNTNEEYQQINYESVTVFCDVDHLVDESEVLPIDETVQSVSLCSVSYTEEMANDVLNVEMEGKTEKYVEYSEDLVQEEGKASSRTTNKKRKTTFDKNTTYECGTCHEPFGTRTQYRQHVKVHGKNRFKCEFCDRWFPEHYKLRNHLKSHSGDMYSCNICSNKFAYLGNLNRHIQVTHENKRGFDCNECGKSFSQLSNLRAHQIGHIKERNFECDKCHKRFQTSDRLDAHKNTHIPMELRIQLGKSQKIRKTQKKKIILCTVCGKSCSPSTIVYHMRSHTGEKPFECEFCNKRFIVKASLSAHLLMHTGEKKYKCKECGKNFKQSGHLSTHMLQHTGHRHYVCSVCSKSFTQNFSLTVHMRIHTGETPYKCEYCQHAFSSSNGLKRHTRIHVQNRDAIIVKEPQDIPSTLDVNFEQRTVEEYNFANDIEGNQS